MSPQFKKISVLLGDLIIFFVALSLVILIRYPDSFNFQFNEHLIPFSIILPFWLLFFYINNLYEHSVFENSWRFIYTLLNSIALSATTSIAFFYFIPYFGITPKTNLFLFILFAFILMIAWRQIFNAITYRQNWNSVLLTGLSQPLSDLKNTILENPQLGYRLSTWLETDSVENHLPQIEEMINSNEVHIIVIPERLRKNVALIKSLYKRLNISLNIKTIDSFYEELFQKIPLSEINETWFLDNVMRRHSSFESLKRVLEIILASILLIILSPLLLIISILIKLSSRGPVLYTQARIGRHEKPFTLYKFRTMRSDAEKNGARWATANDPRQTLIGRFLRRSHLDELPQLINILKGNISFVGPRPERPEFVNELKTIIPFYETRHTVLPGITGWAQINYRYGSSIEDAYEKLQYDLYYIKNRSFWLDLSIIIKTLRTLIKTPK